MSSNLPSTQGDQQLAPFARMNQAGTGLNVGAVAIEQERAIAEAQGQLTLAKKFPRSVTAAITEFLDACNSPAFAATAFYTVPNRGSGPSIRFAEEAARCYGNFVYGHRELSRSEGKSEIEVYAWDMEKNNRSSRQITVMHVTDTKNGPKKLIDQADIDNKIANVASKQMRGRILALMPKHLVAAGSEAAKRTLAGGGEKPISERVIAMAGAFSRFGVSNKHLEAYLGHAVDGTTVDELADLMGVYNAIKEGGKPSEYFQLGETDTGTGAAIAATAKAAALPRTVETKAEPEKAPAADAPAATPAPAAERAPRRAAAAPAPAKSKPAESDSKTEDPAPETAQKSTAAPAEPQQSQAPEGDYDGPGPDDEPLF